MKPTSTQSSMMVNRSAMPASRVTISPKRSRIRPQRSSAVLWVIASNRSTCSPLVYAFNVKRPKCSLKMVRS
jgi:hypothetical protein